MSVINSLGELKSGHHMGLDLKEVWAGGEKVWPSVRQFSLVGPRPGYRSGRFRQFYQGWDSNFPVQGDQGMVFDGPPSSWYHLTFNVPVVCSHDVLAEPYDSNRAIATSYPAGREIPPMYKMVADETGFTSVDQVGTYFTFTDVSPPPEPEPELGLEDGQVVIFGPRPSYDNRTGQFNGFTSSWDTSFDPEGDVSMVESLSTTSAVFTVPVVAEIDLRVAFSSLASPQPHPAGERIPAGSFVSLPNADGFTTEDQIGNPVIFTRVT